MPDLTPELLLHGYSMGIFPMAEHRDDPEIFWVDPRRRGIFPLDGFHISRSLARAMRRTRFTINIDTAFKDVVSGCADRADTPGSDRLDRDLPWQPLTLSPPPPHAGPTDGPGPHGGGSVAHCGSGSHCPVSRVHYIYIYIFPPLR